MARVLGQVPMAWRTSSSKMIPFEIGMTLATGAGAGGAPARVPRGRRARPRKSGTWPSAWRVITRNVGKHAGGVVIAPSRLTDFSPLYCDEQGSRPGYPVRQGRRGRRGAGQVRFSRPAHPHHHRLGGEDDQPRPGARRGKLPLDIMRRFRWTTSPASTCSRAVPDHGGVSAGIPRV